MSCRIQAGGFPLDLIRTGRFSLPRTRSGGVSLDPDQAACPVALQLADSQTFAFSAGSARQLHALADDPEAFRDWATKATDSCRQWLKLQTREETAASDTYWSRWSSPSSDYPDYPCTQRDQPGGGQGAEALDAS